MIPESQFPNLSVETEQRTTGRLLALLVMGQIKPSSDGALNVMVMSFARLVDGALLDYQCAREAFYQFYRDPNLGGSLPVSAALVPCFHHIENCLTNLVRAFEMGDAVRCKKLLRGKKSLIDKNDWKLAVTHEPSISGLRNVIQHRYNKQKKGAQVQGTIEYRESGQIALSVHVLSLTDLARTLQRLKKIACKVVEAQREMQGLPIIIKQQI